MSITSSASPAVDIDTALAHARAAIENRTKYIESLFDAAQAAADAREKVADATRAAERANAEHAAAYKEAVEAGWTAADHTQSGSAPAADTQASTPPSPPVS
jgi:hypothetical protein